MNVQHLFILPGWNLGCKNHYNKAISASIYPNPPDCIQHWREVLAYVIVISYMLHVYHPFFSVHHKPPCPKLRVEKHQSSHIQGE